MTAPRGVPTTNVAVVAGGRRSGLPESPICRCFPRPPEKKCAQMGEKEKCPAGTSWSSSVRRAPVSPRGLPRAAGSVRPGAPEESGGVRATAAARDRAPRRRAPRACLRRALSRAARAVLRASLPPHSTLPSHTDSRASASPPPIPPPPARALSEGRDRGGCCFSADGDGPKWAVLSGPCVD